MTIKKLLFALAFASLLILPSFAWAAETSTPPSSGSNVLYYSYTCPHCKKVEEFFGKYGVLDKFQIAQKEISQNSANAKELEDLLTSRGVARENMAIPYLDFEGQGYLGDAAIIGLFSEKLNIPLSENQNFLERLKTSIANFFGKLNLSGPSKPMSGKSSLTLPAIVIAALADSLNPCAFSVMIFLLLSILSIGSRKKMLKIGLIYVATVYAVYFLAGLGILAFISRFAFISRPLMLAAAIVSIVVGLIYIKDFFFYGKWINLAIGEGQKPIMEKYIKKASLPAALALGFLVAIFELPCTGGFYLAILALLANKATFDTGLLYLVLYNFFFVAPMLAILFIVYYGAKPEMLEEWRVAKRKWMRLIMGAVLFLLGLSLLFIF